jgi:hypothetical protein
MGTTSKLLLVVLGKPKSTDSDGPIQLRVAAGFTVEMPRRIRILAFRSFVAEPFAASWMILQCG